MADRKEKSEVGEFTHLVDVLLKRGGIPALLIGLAAFLLYFEVIPIGPLWNTNMGFWVGAGIALLMIVSGCVLYWKAPAPLDPEAADVLRGIDRELAKIRKAAETIAEEFKVRDFGRDLLDFETKEVSEQTKDSDRSRR